MRTQIEDVPVVLAENAETGFGLQQWITFARDGLDQRGFPAAVRTENCDVLAGFNGKAEIV